MGFHGTPCWYELCTRDPGPAQTFYGPVMGWSFEDAGMEGFTYILGLKDGAMVAGLMDPGEPMPHFWMIYFAVDDCDAAAARVIELGGQIHRAPEDIPGTGRFAVVADPQGAAFGLMQSLPGQEGNAFDQSKSGHGNWNELSTTDPVAALEFYSTLFGWTAGEALDMGEMGVYQLIEREGAGIGGMMGLSPEQAGAPPYWMPYFGSPSVTDGIAAIKASGGTLIHGPQPVPGGAVIAIAHDPQGAFFGIVGPGGATA